MEYTTLAELKAFLNISDTAQDDALSELITRATRLIDVELGDNLEVTTVTRRMNWTWTKRLIMENIINTCTSVKYYTAKDSTEDVEVDFVQGPLIYLCACVPVWDHNVEVAYTKWYAEVPDDMKDFFHIYCKNLMTADSAIKDWEEVRDIKVKKIEGLSVEYVSAEEMSRKDAVFKTNYDAILSKYKNFTINVTN